jgi:hypothetical protein
MAGQGAAPPKQPGVLVRLASRLLLAQAGASAVIGMSFSRRNVPWLVFTLAVAVAIWGLAAALRSGTYGAWLTAVGAESGLVVIGLLRFAYVGYMGGSLLAIIVLGTLLHPAVAGAFARGDRGQASRADHAVIADGAGEPLQGPAVG